MSFTYSSTDISTDLAKVRTLIWDTDSTDALLTDEQVNFFLAQDSNIYKAASNAAKAIAAKYAGNVDKIVDDMSLADSQKYKQYSDLASELLTKSKIHGGGGIYAGGISISDKDSVEDDTDRVLPAFELGQFDYAEEETT